VPQKYSHEFTLAWIHLRHVIAYLWRLPPAPNQTTYEIIQGNVWDDDSGALRILVSPQSAKSDLSPSPSPSYAIAGSWEFAHEANWICKGICNASCSTFCN